MCWGVTAALAALKFSSSPKRRGCPRTKVKNKVEISKTPSKSFNDKNELNEIFIEFEVKPSGFLEPVWCRKVI